MTTTNTQAPSNTWERFHLVPIKFGRKIALTEPTAASFYEGISTVTTEGLEAYYKNTIVPWLNGEYATWVQSHPGAPDPIAVYLMDRTLVVFAQDAAYVTWEAISKFGEYFENKLEAKRLEWHPPKVTEKPSYAA